MHGAAQCSGCLWHGADRVLSITKCSPASAAPAELLALPRLKLLAIMLCSTSGQQSEMLGVRGGAGAVPARVARAVRALKRSI
jgi:hypothetical protein